MLPLNPTTSQFMTLTQELILGMDLAVPMPNRHYRELPVRDGRFLRAGRSPGDGGGGADSPPRAACASGGDGRRWRGQDFQVVGVLDKMLTAPDRFAIVPIEDARELWLPARSAPRPGFGAREPPPRRSQHGRGGGLAGRRGSRRARAPHPGRRCPASTCTIPGELSRLLRQSTAFFSALLFGIGALGLVIGGLSLANTVTAAVFERIRDFGIKRALGATDLQLCREVLGEGLRVSLSGGVLGVGLALARRHRGGRAPASGRPAALLFSPRLLGCALVFSVRWAAGGRLRDPAHRAPVARRGDPAGA